MNPLVIELTAFALSAVGAISALLGSYLKFSSQAHRAPSTLVLEIDGERVEVNVSDLNPDEVARALALLEVSRRSDREPGA